MNTVLPKDFLNDLMPRLNGADEALVEHETFACIRQLCDEGWAWPMDLAPINVTANQPFIFLDPLPDNAVTGYVLLVRFNPTSDNNRVVVPATTQPSQNVKPADTPMSYYMVDPGTMQLNPPPSRDYENALQVSLTMVPNNASTQLPAFFRSHFRDTIINGVMARFTLMGNKPWSNGSLAQIHGRRWRNDIKKTRDETKRRYSMGEGNWNYPYFARKNILPSTGARSWWGAT